MICITPKPLFNCLRVTCPRTAPSGAIIPRARMRAKGTPSPITPSVASNILHSLGCSGVLKRPGTVRYYFCSADEQLVHEGATRRSAAKTLLPHSPQTPEGALGPTTLKRSSRSLRPQNPMASQVLGRVTSLSA
jgi:hypothetical protein